jgi:hypothetical protein
MMPKQMIISSTLIRDKGVDKSATEQYGYTDKCGGRAWLGSTVKAPKVIRLFCNAGSWTEGNFLRKVRRG